MRMRKTVVITVLSTKGGVGKTTTTAGLCGLLADLGMRVLAIDADLQPSLSRYYRPFPETIEATTGVLEVLQRGGQIKDTDIYSTKIPGLDIIISNHNEEIHTWMSNRLDASRLFAKAVSSPHVQENYDFVVIDTQGAKNMLMSSAALAADIMVSPIKPDMISLQEFSAGTMELLEKLDEAKDFVRLGEFCVVITCAAKTKNNQTLRSLIRENFQGNTRLKILDTEIPASTAFEQAASMNLPPHRMQPPAKGQVSLSAYEVMHHLVFELFPNLNDIWVGEAGKSPVKHAAIDGAEDEVVSNVH